MKGKSSVILLALLALCIPQYSHAETRYEVVDLGHRFIPSDISNVGDVVGSSINGACPGLYWSQGVLTEIKAAGFVRVIPKAISDVGVIAGAGFTTDGTTKPLLLDKYSALTLADRGVCTDINSFGMAVGSIRGSGGETRGVFWQNGFLTDCGSFGGFPIDARKISSNGDIVGFVDTSKGYLNAKGEYFPYKRAVIRSNTGITELGVLGGDRSYALAINSKGMAVGASEVAKEERFSPIHAFVWQNGMMVDIGTLGGKVSGASAINERGQIVGNSSLKQSKTPHAFIWQDSVMSDLNELIPDGSGWILSSANAINDSGCIVGTGFLNSKFHGYLLVPQPAESSGQGMTGSLNTQGEAQR